jgi:hypothetical protein
MSQIKKGNSTRNCDFNLMISAIFSVTAQRVVVIFNTFRDNLTVPIFEGQESEKTAGNPTRCVVYIGTSEGGGLSSVQTAHRLDGRDSREGKQQSSAPL